MPNHLTKEYIDILTSKIWYSKFELGLNECENVQFCRNIKDELQNSYNINPSISDKIVKALCYVYKRKRYHANEFDEEHCSYLYYWLGDKIYKNIGNKSLFFKIIKMIYDELNLSNIENITICKQVKSSINSNNFDINKLLFDYSKDYVNIRFHTSPGNTTCDSVYKKFLEKYIEIYNDAYSTCKEGNQQKYDCDNFSSILNTKLYNELSTFNCKERQNVAQPPKIPRELEVKEITQAHLLPHPQSRYSTKYHSTSEGLDLGRSTVSGVQQDQESIQPFKMDDTAKSGTSKTIAGSVAPVLGVSSISLLLYKVTPLGGFIRNFLGRNRNMYNPVEYMDGFNPYNDGMDPVGRTMNISYHRL